MKYEKGDKVRFINWGTFKEKRFVFEGEIVGYKLGFFTGKVKWYQIARLDPPLTVEYVYPEDVVDKLNNL